MLERMDESNGSLIRDSMKRYKELKELAFKQSNEELKKQNEKLREMLEEYIRTNNKKN